MCVDKGNVRSWNKEVDTFDFFACGGLIICVLMKKMSDPGIKRFQHLKFFRLRRAHIMCFDRVNVRSRNKKGSTFKIFHEMCFNRRNIRFWNKIVFNPLDTIQRVSELRGRF